MVLSYESSHSFFSQFIIVLKSLNRAYTKLDCIKTGPQITDSGITWKRFIAFFFFHIYIDLASSINRKFGVNVVSMEGRNGD